MRHPTKERGDAFEDWTRDVLRPYAPDIQRTVDNEHFDLVFKDSEGMVVLLECKLQSRRGRTVLKRTQAEHLKKSLNGLYGKNTICYVIGVYIPPADMVPFVVSLEDAFKLGNGKSRTMLNLSSKKVLASTPLRVWIGERWEVDPYQVLYPEFRRYLKGGK